MAYSRQDAAGKVLAACRKLVSSGLIARTWGNVSARLDADSFLITPSGRAYESLTPEDLVPVSLETLKPLSEGRPSSEKGMHAVLYRQRPDVNFIVHTHQNYASALSILGQDLSIAAVRPALEPILGQTVPTAAYGLSSTKTLAENVGAAAQAVPACRAVLMQNHGAVCFAEEDAAAFAVAEALEEASAEQYRRIVGSLLPDGADRAEPDRYYYRVLHAEVCEQYAEHYAAFEKPGVGCVIDTATPFVRKYSSLGVSMPVYIDDLAQMVGIRVSCLPAKASEIAVGKALGGVPGAVFLKGLGAVCRGRDEDDAAALCMVLEKAAMAALLAQAGAPAQRVLPAAGILEHAIYLQKYSKLKNERKG